MIDDEKTFLEKGYYSTDLKPNSHKKVYAVCEGEDCQREGGRGRWVIYQLYRKLCPSCAQKKKKIQKCKTPTEKRECIDDDITYAEKGYRSTELMPNSAKPVWAICQGENCEREGGRGRWVQFRACRDLCSLCASKILRKYNYDGFEDIVRSIDEEKTYAEKGYRSSDLSAQSHKDVYAICVECGNGRWIEFRAYSDVCQKCINRTEKRRKSQSEFMTGRECSDITRINMSAVRQGISVEEWNGFISFGKYCEKFNKVFKESIREKFGRECFLCGRDEEDNKKKLDVHHVSYDKECMCNGVECEFVPLCRKCHVMTNHNREMWRRMIMNQLVMEGYI